MATLEYYKITVIRKDCFIPFYKSEWSCKSASSTNKSIKRNILYRKYRENTEIKDKYTACFIIHSYGTRFRKVWPRLDVLIFWIILGASVRNIVLIVVRVICINW